MHRWVDLRQYSVQRWVERLLRRRNFNVVVAALANKMARAASAGLAKGKTLDPLKWNPAETAYASGHPILSRFR